MSKKIIIPPIKSQGIKTKLVPWIQAIIPDREGRLIEPFMGTGVVAFNLGFTKTWLCDVNPHLINFYNSIKNKTITPQIVEKYLKEEGEKLRVAEENGYKHYRTIRDRFNDKFDPLDFLFLSRAGFNGMIRFNKTGKWNIPFCKKPERFSKAYVTKIVNQVIKVSKQISDDWLFECKDFRQIIPNASASDVIYCDPPYHGRYVDYYNGWTDQDEKDLFDLLSATKAKFILSTWHHNDFRENNMINLYWQNFNIITKDHFYHSGGKIENRNKIVEALVTNFKTNITPHNFQKLPDTEQLNLLNLMKENKQIKKMTA